MMDWPNNNSFEVKPEDVERINEMLGAALEAEVSNLPEIFQEAIARGMKTGQLERLSRGGSILQQTYTEVFVKDSKQFQQEDLLEIFAEELPSIFGLEVISQTNSQFGTVFECKRGVVDVSAFVSFFPTEASEIDTFGEKLIIVQIFTKTDNRN